MCCADVVLACLLTLLVLLALAVALAPGPRGSGARDRFFTESAREEPTRAYTPYTGTVPFGHWGAQPWAEAVPLTRGGEFRCYGSLADVNNLLQPQCRTCGGSRNYHDSVQRARPHPFLEGDVADLLPYQAGPHWEGGLPALN
jgi:hypothetical protein